MFQFDHSGVLRCLSALDGVEAGLLAAVDAHGLDVDAGDGDQVGAVLRVEVVQVGLVLEVVGVHRAVLDHVVGDDVVVKFLDVQGDALGLQDGHADLQHFAVGGGGGGAAHGLAGQGVVVHFGVVAVGGVLHHRHHRAAVLLQHKVLHLLAFQRGGQGLDAGVVFVALFADQHVDVAGGAVLHGQGLGHGVQPGGDGVVGVDDGVVLVLQDVGHLGGLHLVDGDVEGVVRDVVLGGGDAGPFLQGEEAVLFQQLEGAGLVGGVVGDGHVEAGAAARAARAGGQGGGRGGQAGGLQECAARDLVHSKAPFCIHCCSMLRVYRRDGKKKAPVPTGIKHLQGRELECFRGTTLVRRPLAGRGLSAAAGRKGPAYSRTL